MAWFKVDDQFWGHPKRLACTPAEIGLWVIAGSWSAQQQQDGRVPRHVLPVLGGRPRDAAALVRAGLWKETDDGWVFHGWAEFQPTKQQLDERREEETRRKQAWRDKRAAEKAEAQRQSQEASSSVPSVSQRDTRGTEANVPEGVPPLSQRTRPEPDPSPTRPDPNPSSLREDVQGQDLTTLAPKPPKPSRKKRVATEAPDELEITDAMRAWGRANAPLITDPVRETEKFLDHARANGKSFSDWPAAWRTWMGNAQTFAGRGGSFSHGPNNKAEERDRRNLALVQHFAPTYEQGVIGA